jgi:transposase, IS6 family
MIYRWVQHFTPLLINAAQPCRHVPGDRWFTDEPQGQGRWAVGLSVPRDRPARAGHRRDGSEKRDLAATCRFFTRALRHGLRPTKVSTDRALAYPRALDDLMPTAGHTMQKYANNPIESDHSRLKPRLRPMRGLTQLRCAGDQRRARVHPEPPPRPRRTRGEEVANLRVLVTFDDLALAI